MRSTVLCVIDDDGLRALVCEVLEDDGVTALQAVNGLGVDSVVSRPLSLDDVVQAVRDVLAAVPVQSVVRDDAAAS